MEDKNTASGAASAERRALIFGGAGFIGANWAHYLLANSEAQVHIFDNLSRPGVAANLESLKSAAEDAGAGSDRLRVTIADVRERAAVEAAMEGATEVYHFAAQVAVTTSVANPREDFEVNLGGTFNILEAARRAERKPFLLFTSTNKVYGDLGSPAVEAMGDAYRFADGRGISEAQPLDFHSPYGCSKGAADQYVRDYGRIYGVPTVVLRMSCIAGARQLGTEDQGWVAHFLYSALAEKGVTIFGDGRQVRDVLDVRDLMRAFEAVRSEPRAHGQVFNVGGGAANAVSLRELMSHIETMTGRPMQVAFDERRPGDQLIYITEFAKLTELTGWQPRFGVSEILQSIAEWRASHAQAAFPATTERETAEAAA